MMSRRSRVFPLSRLNFKVVQYQESRNQWNSPLEFIKFKVNTRIVCYLRHIFPINNSKFENIQEHLLFLTFTCKSNLFLNSRESNFRRNFIYLIQYSGQFEYHSITGKTNLFNRNWIMQKGNIQRNLITDDEKDDGRKNEREGNKFIFLFLRVYSDPTDLTHQG